MNKQNIITTFPTFRRLPIAFLLAIVVMVVYGQADSTKVKKKKEDRISMYGTVADGFTKAAIPDVKVILMREDSTVIDTTTVWESHSWSSGIGRSLGTTRFHFWISREPAKYILKVENPNYETAFANFETKQISKRRQDIEGPKVYLKKTAQAHHFEGGSLDEVVVKATKVKMVWRGIRWSSTAIAMNICAMP